MKILEEQPSVHPEDETEIASTDIVNTPRVSNQNRSRIYTVAVLDGMAELQNVKEKILI